MAGVGVKVPTQLANGDVVFPKKSSVPLSGGAISVTANLGAAAVGSTLVERLSFSLSLDKEASSRYQESLRTAKILDFKIEDGDRLTISWGVSLGYLGNSEVSLRVFEELIRDPSVVCEVDVNELNYGYSLLLNVVQRVGAIRSLLLTREKTEIPKKSIF